MDEREPHNPDQQLVRRFLQAPEPGLPVDTNPVAIDLGMRLQAWEAASGTLVLGFHAQARHLQGSGVVHGGIVSTMLDFGLAYVLLGQLTPPRMTVTASLNVQFERAVRPGELTVRARIERLGGRIAFASASLHAPGGEVLARATGTMAVV